MWCVRAGVEFPDKKIGFRPTPRTTQTLRPDCLVYSAEPENCPSFGEALRAGHPVKVVTRPTLADGLAVPQMGANAFVIAREYTDMNVTVSEMEVARAVLRCVEMEKLTVEGGGVAGLAAILPGGRLHEEVQGKKVVIPLCGGNIDVTVLGRVIDRGLAADGRLVRVVVTVSDRPGGISGLTTVLAESGASIKDIFHERAWLTAAIDEVGSPAFSYAHPLGALYSTLPHSIGSVECSPLVAGSPFRISPMNSHTALAL